MKTFTFAEKNGNAVITLSAKTEKEAELYLKEILSMDRKSFLVGCEENE